MGDKILYLTHITDDRLPLDDVEALAEKHGAQLLARNCLAVETMTPQERDLMSGPGCEWLFKIKALDSFAAETILCDIEEDLKPQNLTALRNAAIDAWRERYYEILMFDGEPPVSLESFRRRFLATQTQK